MIPLAQNTYASTSTCIPSTIGGQTAALTDDTCEATITCGIVDSPPNCREIGYGIFSDQCAFLAGGNFTKTPTSFTCTFESSPPA